MEIDNASLIPGKEFTLTLAARTVDLQYHPRCASLCTLQEVAYSKGSERENNQRYHIGPRSGEIILQWARVTLYIPATAYSVRSIFRDSNPCPFGDHFLIIRNYNFRASPLRTPPFSTITNMQIRDATISDIPHLAALFITAFSDDPDYETAYPWRSSAPDDYAQLMTAEIMQMFLKGQGRLLVVETEQRQVVAWACWTRKGSSAAAGRIRAENDSLLKGVFLSSHRAGIRKPG